MGLKNYTFVNSTGLNNAQLDGMEPAGTGKTAENKMPAKSVAKLAYHLLKDHPDVLKTSSITKKHSVKVQMMQLKCLTGISCYRVLYLNMKV